MEDDDRDDAGALIPDLVKQFMNDPEPFIDSESSRAPLRGQVWCCCACTATDFLDSRVSVFTRPV